MSFRLTGLPNPAADDSKPARGSDDDETRHNAPDADATTTAYEAADALASLAQSGGIGVNNMSSFSGQSSMPNDLGHLSAPTAPHDAPFHPSALDGYQLQGTAIDRDQAAPTQIRQPSPLIKSEKSHFGEAGSLTSMNIKTEPFGENTTTRADEETLRTVTNLQNEHGLRGVNKDTSTAVTETKPTMAPASKKRPKSTKKGPGKRPSKKQKLEADAPGTTSAPLSRSATPNRGLKAPAAKGNKSSQSGTPAVGSPVSYSNQPSSDVEASDSEEDDSIYCICRGKDDHTWMIGCDGCDDWFHGRCVDLRKDDHELLLHKFMCPNCEAEGKGHTIWKPMCRREGCRKPAAEVNGERSKYCSDVCGVEFFSNVIRAVSRLNAMSTTGQRKRQSAAKRKVNTTDAPEHVFEYSEDEYEAPPRGGTIRSRDLKALVSLVPNVSEFHRLGSGFLSPPATPSGMSMDTLNGPFEPTYPLTASESARMVELHALQEKLNNELLSLKDREKFILMIRERANHWAEGEGIKQKTQICGWDTRLQWNEAQFELWRSNAYGKACLDRNTWTPSAEDLVKARSSLGASEKVDHEGDVEMLEEDDAAANEAQPEEYTGPLDESAWCPKKQCPLHRGWQKLHTQEFRFEQGEVGQTMRALSNEEKEIRERALVRWRREKVGEGLDRESTNTEKKNCEGWVEVVG